jgi:hypothetical protein
VPESTRCPWLVTNTTPRTGTDNLARSSDTALDLLSVKEKPVITGQARRVVASFLSSPGGSDRDQSFLANGPCPPVSRKLQFSRILFCFGKKDGSVPIQRSGHSVSLRIRTRIRLVCPGAVDRENCWMMARLVHAPAPFPLDGVGPPTPHVRCIRSAVPRDRSRSSG